MNYEIDNRDIDTTVLTLASGEEIEVNAFDLLKNAVENNVDEDVTEDELISEIEYTISEYSSSRDNLVEQIKADIIRKMRMILVVETNSHFD